MRPVPIINERPLHAGREARAAAAAQAGILDHIGHLGGLHPRDSILERGETAVLFVDAQFMNIRYFSMT